jgi:hypothetical protein
MFTSRTRSGAIPKTDATCSIIVSIMNTVSTNTEINTHKKKKKKKYLSVIMGKKDKSHEEKSIPFPTKKIAFMKLRSGPPCLLPYLP